MYQKRKNPIRFLIWIIVLAGVIFFAGKWYFNYLKSPVDPKGEVKAFVVNKGEAISEVADKLEQEKLIRSSLVFNFLIKDKSLNVAAGDFKLSSAMSIEEIINKLQSGPVDKWVTLLEGWRDEEMAQKLNQELGISQDEFLKLAKQGYMFPDTYLFNPASSAENITQTMKTNFDRKYTNDLQAQVGKNGLTSDQGVILASIVEREARSDKVRTNVASILLKRLKIGMGLNADATVQYALGYQNGEKSWWKRNLTLDDLKIKSPYNTYISVGLPPTPICNPSLSSLKAVTNADPSTPYLYYYHDSQGSSYYAKTLEEHNQNVAEHP